MCDSLHKQFCLFQVPRFLFLEGKKERGGGGIVHAPVSEKGMGTDGASDFYFTPFTSGAALIFTPLFSQLVSFGQH